MGGMFVDSIACSYCLVAKIADSVLDPMSRGG